MHLTEEESQRLIGGDRRQDPARRSRTGRPGDPSHLIKVGARSSPLSRAQVEEARLLYPHLHFDPVWVETTGDRNKEISLRTLDKTDFFTRELDEMLLREEIDIAIHSAKDLPEPLPEGLCIAALTKGLDPRDSLVFREGETFQSLPSGAWIATSSERREEAVRSLRSDLRFKDVRGTIAERLSLLKTGEADGVVIAEAALLRLNLHALNRIYLPGPTVPGQGQLAILCRIADEEIGRLFIPSVV